MTAPTAPQRPGWLLDDLETAGRENLDSDHVARYDAKMDARAAEEVEPPQELGLTRRSDVVDHWPGPVSSPSRLRLPRAMLWRWASRR